MFIVVAYEPSILVKFSPTPLPWMLYVYKNLFWTAQYKHYLWFSDFWSCDESACHRSIPKLDPDFVTFLVGVRESSIIFFLSAIMLIEQDSG